MTLNELCSGLIGSILGGILTCIITCVYSSYSEKIKLKREIQLKAYGDVIDNIFKTKQSLSYLITYVNTYIINSKNQYEFINKSIDIITDNYNDLCYDFAKDCTGLMGSIDKRQLIFVEFRNYIDNLYKILKETVKISNDLKSKIENIEVIDIESKFTELNNISIKLNKLLWNFAIDMENLFLSKVLKKRINKNIKPTRV